MHNKDFENNVQQKMQELRFTPSKEVWMRVEAGIEKKKDKRRFAFWMFVPFILGGSILWFVSRESSGVRNENSNVKKATLNTSIHPNSPTQKIELNKNIVSKENVIAEVKQVAKYSAVSAVKEKGGREDKGGKEEKEVTVEKGIGEKPEVANDSATSAVKLEETKTKEPLIEKESAKKTLKSKSKWSFGLEASAGFSSFTQGLLQRDAATAGYYYDPLAYGNNTPGSVFKPSEVKQGFAYSVGVFASRSLSKKLDVRLGLSYMHATTSMKVGQRIDSARAVNQSNMAMDKVEGYYTVGTSNRYTNKYSLIGASVALDWHITRKLSWQNGINFARLVNSNALHFDGLTGSYYEDDRLYNKNQVLASSSIQFNVLNKISVGPEARFALTDMLKNNVNDKKHLRYIGIKSVYRIK